MIIPPYLRQGDKVGIVAPAKKVDHEKILKGTEILEQWGLQLEYGAQVFNAFNQFSGTDLQRINDLQAMINNHEIKAIFMARGGYGSTRIVNQIDYDVLKVNPKWICGFSDITAFHLHLFNLEIASLHSPMPATFRMSDDRSMDWMKRLIFGEQTSFQIDPHEHNISGVTKGKLTGGNLSLICSTIGTASQINTAGNILFIEDVGEKLYRLDRMMVQLKNAGLLTQLSGLIVGQFSEMEDDEVKFGLDPNQIIQSHISEFNYPVAFDFPVGHTPKNMAIPVGVEGALTVEESTASLALNR